MTKDSSHVDLTKDRVKIGRDHSGPTREYTPPDQYDESFNPLDDARDPKEPLRRSQK